MFWLLMYNDEDGYDCLYLCKAETIDKACSMTGIRKEDIKHCVISKDVFDHLSNIEGGYVRMQF